MNRDCCQARISAERKLAGLLNSTCCANKPRSRFLISRSSLEAAHIVHSFFHQAHSPSAEIICVLSYVCILWEATVFTRVFLNLIKIMIDNDWFCFLQMCHAVIETLSLCQIKKASSSAHGELLKIKIATLYKKRYHTYTNFNSSKWRGTCKFLRFDYWNWI